MTRRRRPNTLLRLARERRRETQQQVAQAMGELLGWPVDAEYIGRLERGVITWPNARHRQALRTHLGVASDAELWFYTRRSAPDLLEEEDDVRRRAFLAALPVAGAAASDPLGSLVRLAAAEPVPPPRRVGAEHVEQVRAMIAQAHEINNRFGGGLATEMLGGQLRWAVGLLDAHVDPAAPGTPPGRRMTSVPTPPRPAITSWRCAAPPRLMTGGCGPKSSPAWRGPPSTPATGRRR